MLIARFASSLCYRLVIELNLEKRHGVKYKGALCYWSFQTLRLSIIIVHELIDCSDFDEHDARPNSKHLCLRMIPRGRFRLYHFICKAARKVCLKQFSARSFDVDNSFQTNFLKSASADFEFIISHESFLAADFKFRS